MSGVRIKKTWVMLSVCAAFLSGAGIALADDDMSAAGSVEVESDVACSAGKIVTGLTGGQAELTEVCVSPNSGAMPVVNQDAGEPNTTS